MYAVMSGSSGIWGAPLLANFARTGNLYQIASIESCLQTRPQSRFGARTFRLAIDSRAHFGVNCQPFWEFWGK
jgi:hypothetical protein